MLIISDEILLYNQWTLCTSLNNISRDFWLSLPTWIHSPSKVFVGSTWILLTNEHDNKIESVRQFHYGWNNEADKVNIGIKTFWSLIDCQKILTMMFSLVNFFCFEYDCLLSLYGCNIKTTSTYSRIVTKLFPTFALSTCDILKHRLTLNTLGYKQLTCTSYMSIIFLL